MYKTPPTAYDAAITPVVLSFIDRVYSVAAVGTRVAGNTV